eukprot:5360950-Amphidinium_carterae.1
MEASSDLVCLASAVSRKIMMLSTILDDLGCVLNVGDSAAFTADTLCQVTDGGNLLDTHEF